MNAVLLIFIELAALMDLYSASNNTLYSFGYEVPMTIEPMPLNPPNGSTNMAYLTTNVIFDGSYYIVGFELYTTAAASFQVTIDDWSNSPYFNCWSAFNSSYCASFMNNCGSIGTYEFSSGTVVTFTSVTNYNYCEFVSPVQVSSNQTLELIQSTTGKDGNIFAIDTGATASYPDTVIESIISGRIYIEPMDPTLNKRIYVRAWGYASDPDVNGTGLCSSVFTPNATEETTTSTTTTTTTIATTTTQPTTMTIISKTKIGTTLSTTNSASKTTTSAEITTVLTTATTTSSSTVSTTTLSTLGPIVTFNAAELANLISSNYAGDITGCLVNCSSKGYCYVNTTTGVIGCACKTNFTGTSCQTDLRICSSSPCSNGGTCVDIISGTIKSFYCECSQYYYGSLCEYIFDVCANQTCSSHGSCANVNHTATCDCYSGYSGTSCENEEQSLKVNKQIIQSTSIIAIAFIVLFYMIFVICDLHTWYVGGRRRMHHDRYKRKWMKKNRRTQQNQTVGVGIYRFQYIN